MIFTHIHVTLNACILLKENFLSIAGMDDYSCYFCTYGSNTIDIVIEHNIKEHLDKDLKIKRKIFTEDSGQFAYRAVHFPRTVFSLKQQLDRGFKWVVDIETKSVRYKRAKKDPNIVDDQDIDEATHHEQTLQNDTSCDDDVKNLAVNVIRIISETGRGGDFLSALKAIQSGVLPVENIALQLFLDIGQFLSVQTVNHVRYSQVGIDFWTVVRKLFKGKATRLFRGFMAQESESSPGVYALINIPVGRA